MSIEECCERLRNETRTLVMDEVNRLTDEIIAEASALLDAIDDQSVIGLLGAFATSSRGQRSACIRIIARAAAIPLSGSFREDAVEHAADLMLQDVALLRGGREES